MKAKQLGVVVFEYPQEVMRECGVKGEKRVSVAGTKIVYESLMLSPDITLASATDDWLSLNNIHDLSTMCGQINTTFTLIYEDDSTEEVVFDHSKAISFKEIKEGSCFFHGNVSLIKI